MCHRNRLEKIQPVSKNNQQPFRAHTSSSGGGEPRETKAQSCSHLLFGAGQPRAVSLSTSQFTCGEARRSGDRCLTPTRRHGQRTLSVRLPTCANRWRARKYCSLLRLPFSRRELISPSRLLTKHGHLYLNREAEDYLACENSAQFLPRS